MTESRRIPCVFRPFRARSSAPIVVSHRLPSTESAPRDCSTAAESLRHADAAGQPGTGNRAVFARTERQHTGSDLRRCRPRMPRICDQSCESHMRVGQARPTYGRTDGLTKSRCHLTRPPVSFVTRTRAYGFFPISSQRHTPAQTKGAAMTEDDQDQPDAGEGWLRQHSCSTCGAQPGEPCRGAQGNPWRFSHAARHPSVTSTTPLTVITALDVPTIPGHVFEPTTGNGDDVAPADLEPAATICEGCHGLGVLNDARLGVVRCSTCGGWGAIEAEDAQTARTQPLPLAAVAEHLQPSSVAQEAAQPVDLARVDLALAREAIRVRTPEQLEQWSREAAADRLDQAVDGVTRVIAAHLPGWRGHEQSCMGCDWTGSFHGRHLAAMIADWLRDNPGHAVAMVGRPA